MKARSSCNTSVLSTASEQASKVARLTLHGLLSSNPAGAFTLSVCPRRKPVSRLSLSITVRMTTLANAPSDVAQDPYRDQNVLCLSHASTECLARFPPFCMCLIFERVAPVNPNIWKHLFSSIISFREVGHRTPSCSNVSAL